MKSKFLAALFLLLPLAAQATNLATVPISRMDLPWWRSRFTQTLTNAKAEPNAKIVWLGDSITQYWQRQGTLGYDNIIPVWNHYYAPYHALDFGMVGDTTASLIWRLDHGQVAGLHPKLAIILIGANNLGRVHWGAAMTVPGIEAVINNTQARLPTAHILLLGILPSIRSAWVAEQTNLINVALADHYDHDATVTFINAGSIFLQHGKPNPTLYIDPHLVPPEPALHPNAQAMATLAAFIEPEVKLYAQ